MTYLALGIFDETLKFESLAMERYCRRAFTPVSPNYIRDGGTQPIATGEYCSLTGATVEMEFLADAVDSTYAAVKIVPREGDQVDANFELYSLR
jgi:hypothetical protein